MSQLTKQQLKGENQTQFPNNNVGAITPSNLRAFNVDMIDSTVNQTDFTNFSGSVAGEIDALEAFSQSLTTNFVTSASFATYSQSVGVELNTIEGDIIQLQNFSTSLDTNFVNQAELAAATGSLLETASLSGGTLTFTKGDSSTFGINLPTASITASYGSFSYSGSIALTSGVSQLLPFDTIQYASLISLSGSSGIVVTEPGIYDFDLYTQMTGQGNTVSNLFWITKNGNNVTNSTIVNSPGIGGTSIRSGNQRVWQLQADAGDTFQFYVQQNGSNSRITGSIAGATYSSYNILGEPIPASPSILLNVNRVDVGGLVSGSFTNIQSLNQYTASNDQKWNTLGGQTGSFITEAETGSMTVLSASFATTAAFALNANFNTASFVGTASFNAYTQSTDSRLSNIENATASFITESETGSFARVDASNTFTQTNSFLQDVTISGNLYVSGSEVVVSSSTLIVGDRIIEVNANRVIGDAGIYAFDAFTNQTGSMIWDPFVDYWKAGLSGSETRVITAADTASLLAPYLTTASFNAATGAFATTGSNTFRGNETFEDAGGNASTLVPVSGSLMLVAKTFTSASTHFSASAGNQINLIFKSNNTVSSLTISGSDNLISNPAAATAGLRRFIGSGGGNITIGTLGTNIPQISSSMAFPITMNNNYVAGAMTMRGPVSASSYVVSTNAILGTLNIGSAPTTDARSLVSSTTVSTNVIAGTLNLIANQAPISSAINITANNIAGVTQLIMSSSGISVLQNNINDQSFNFINQFSSGAVGQGLTIAIANTIGGQNNSFLVTGSQLVSGLMPTFNHNLIAGNTNTVFVNTADSRVSGSLIYHNALSTGLIGQRLIVTGSSNVSDLNSFGSLFVGRWNADDSIRNNTRNIIFAVGTGISGSRKTGLHIDSGSNTFIEGTLNVSGATSLNGNLIITGSLTASLAQGFTYVGNASGITEAVATSSIVVATASFATNATDIVVSVKNTTGVQINKGTVVRIIGATGDNALIGTASWEDDNNSANTLGFVVNDIANDAFGRVMTQGTLLAVDTDPTLGYAAGDLIYLSSSGQYTNVKPPAPYHEVRLGQVLRAQQNNGSIYVLIQNGYELDELHDVSINTGSLVNNDLLAYDSASTQWVNRTVTGVGALTTSSFNAATGAFATTGSNTFVGTETISGSLIVTGSARGNVRALSITSNTASMDMSAANYFTLTLADTATTHITATNIQPGLSATLVITTGTNSSASLAPTLLQPSGSSYVASNGSAKKDILSFVAFDTTNMFVVSTKNMI